MDIDCNCKNKPAAQPAGQTLPYATPPVGKIHSFSKIVVSFEPIQLFDALQDLESPKKCQYSFFYVWKQYSNKVCFMTGSTIFNRFGVIAS